MRHIGMLCLGLSLFAVGGVAHAQAAPPPPPIPGSNSFQAVVSADVAPECRFETGQVDVSLSNLNPELVNGQVRFKCNFDGVIHTNFRTMNGYLVDDATGQRYPYDFQVGMEPDSGWLQAENFIGNGLDGTYGGSSPVSYYSFRLRGPIFTAGHFSDTFVLSFAP